MKYSRELCGSKLEILIHQEGVFSDLIEKSFAIGEDFENKYSRFIQGNFLDNLNTNKSSVIDREFYTIISLCLKISDITDGFFDITVRDRLEKKGYGSVNKSPSDNIGYKNIILENEKIHLRNNVSIDLGSVGKGFIVDKIYSLLTKEIDKFTINFGGDIRVKGKQEIKLEDPINTSMNLGSILISDSSIASSSGTKRTFNKSHHLIDMKSGKSQNDKKIIYVTHKLATFSDIICTALYVSPLEKSIGILASIDGLEGMIIDTKGQIHKTKGFLFTQH